MLGSWITLAVATVVLYRQSKVTAFGDVRGLIGGKMLRDVGRDCPQEVS